MTRPHITFRPIAELVPYARNARTHGPEQVKQIAGLIRDYGWTNAILVDGDGLVAGHGRLLAAQQLNDAGVELRFVDGTPIPAGHVPTISTKGWTEQQRRAYILADNQSALNAGWNLEVLALELDEMRDLGVDLDAIGFPAATIADLIGTDKTGPAPREVGSLSAAFMVPPFSILNAREGWWQARKRGWLALGIKSELGRGGESHSTPPHGPTVTQGPDGKLQYRGATRSTWNNRQPDARSFRQDLMKGEGRLSPGGSPRPAMNYADRERGAGDGQPLTAEGSGTSIFDPVVCEIAYRWFSPPGGVVLDPFAGGSVRGIVAAVLDRGYVGIDLSARQIDANRAQAEAILHAVTRPAWIVGDSRNAVQLLEGTSVLSMGVDMVFTCPPYADLEVYSDDPRDLSNMHYSAFLEGYREAIRASCFLLKPDRFACVVVGEVRDKTTGHYRDFVGDTVQAFRDAGLGFYNEAILITAAGSLPIRAGKQFTTSRKLGKTHQNILVFVKGDAKRAVAACGPVEVDPSLLDLPPEEGVDLGQNDEGPLSGPNEGVLEDPARGDAGMSSDASLS